MKERVNVSFRVSKFNIREYMRKRNIRRANSRVYDRWYNSLSAQEKRELNDELIWRVDHWMYVDQVLPPSIPDEVVKDIGNMIHYQ